MHMHMYARLQEKFDLAAYHFQRALRINPRSSVLHCYLGMTLHALRRPNDALKALADAHRLEKAK
jgi:anaphase-promoting complex subunit 3